MPGGITRSGLLLLLMAGSLILAGCGSPAGTPESRTPASAGSSGTPSATGNDTVSTPDTSLTVVVTTAGRTQRWQLTCDPSGGDHPTPERACATVRDHAPSTLAPVPGDRICAQVHGGDDTARITGLWQGTHVDAVFSRTDACQITRWDRFVGVLPEASG